MKRRSTSQGAPMLSGVRVLDLSAMGPGPRTARILADYGAEVVKVLPPERRLGSQEFAPRAAYGWYRDIERIAVDLKQAEGLALVRRLAQHSDVVIESYRPGVADRLGVGFDALAAANERLVYCAISGYGQSGPYANWAAHDLNWLGVGGFLALTGHTAEKVPALPGAVVADSAGGMCASIAILGALVRRAASGAGGYLDVSILEAVLRMTYVSVDEFLGAGRPQVQGSGELLGGSAYYGVYRTGDGKFLTVASIEPNFFANLCRLLDVEQAIPWQRDPKRQDAIRKLLTERFLTRSRDEWVNELGPADTCVGPVYEIDELPHDPHIVERDLIWKVQHDLLGTVSQVAPWLTAANPPTGGTSTVRDLRSTSPRQVLATIGVDDATIQDLLTRSVVG